MEKNSDNPSAQTLVWTQGWDNWQKVDLCEYPGQIQPLNNNNGNVSISQKLELPMIGVAYLENNSDRYPKLSYIDEDDADKQLATAMSKMLHPPVPRDDSRHFSHQNLVAGQFKSIKERATFQYNTSEPVQKQIERRLEYQHTVKHSEDMTSQGAFGGAPPFTGMWKLPEETENQENNFEQHENNGLYAIEKEQEVIKPNSQNNKVFVQTLKFSRNYRLFEILKIPYDELKPIKKIGEGAFGQVLLAEWLTILVAVKTLKNDGGDTVIKDFKQEVKMLGMLSHENVVQIRAVSEEATKLSIVMEFVPFGTLYSQLHPADGEQSSELPLWQRLQWALEVAKGMLFLHYRNVEHRDLKTSNLLLDRGNKVKISDFGLSKTRQSISMKNQSVMGIGTVQYMAPEQMNDQLPLEDGKKVDVFSFGVVLWELVTQQIPWDGEDWNVILGLVGYKDRRLEVPQEVSEDVRQIILKCWSKNPMERPSFSDIVEKLVFIVKQMTPEQH